jgi:hypothetical protein
MIFAMVKIVTPGQQARSAVFKTNRPGVHLRMKMMDGRDRRAEATPPAKTGESSL